MEDRKKKFTHGKTEKTKEQFLNIPLCVRGVTEDNCEAMRTNKKNWMKNAKK